MNELLFTQVGMITIRAIDPTDGARWGVFQNLLADENVMARQMRPTVEGAAGHCAKQTKLVKDNRADYFLAFWGFDIVGEAFSMPTPPTIQASPRLGIALLSCVHGLGLATRLMQLLEQGAYMRGHDRVLLTVIAQNTAARRLYQRLGYRPTGHTCNGSITRAGSKASKIEMYKELRA